jgi:type II secretory pathway pseudopilin PulG
MSIPPRTETQSAVVSKAAPRVEGQYDRSSGTRPIETPWTGLSLLVLVLSLILSMALPRTKTHPQQKEQKAAALLATQAERQLTLAIREYRHEHGEWPGLAPTDAARLASSSTPSSAWLTRQLCLASDWRGEVSPLSTPEFPLGPYLPGQLPLNPLTGLRSVRLCGEGFDLSPLAEECGWIYDPYSGEVRGCPSSF